MSDTLFAANTFNRQAIASSTTTFRAISSQNFRHQNPPNP
jgi:hypothetical protein